MKEPFLSFMSISVACQRAAAIRTAEEGDRHLTDQHEGCAVSQGHCDGDVYGAVGQQARDCDHSGTGGESGREQPCATRGHRDGDRVERRHARQAARAHER